VADSLDTAVKKLPKDPATAVEDAASPSWRHSCSASTGKSGYVQVIDHEALVELAAEHDLLIVLKIRAGHFMLHDTSHFEIHSNEPVSNDILAAVAKTFLVGSGRTPTQDLEFSVRQLVEIALRALSPSLNDPFTAIAVINRLASALEIVAGRCLPSQDHRDGDGRLRVIADITHFAGLMDVAFNQIRQSAGSNAAVLISLARRLSDLLQVASSDEQRQANTKHLQMVERAAQTIPEPLDRDDLLSVIASARERQGS
jgi:uncharacterized membrane protein